WTDTGEEILLGRINADNIKTQYQMMAFIAGVFARFGMPCDTAYNISIANSVSKTRLCNQILTELKSKPNYQILRNFIPVGHHIYFHPSNKLKAYLSKYSVDINNQLADALKEYINRTVLKNAPNADSGINHPH